MDFARQVAALPVRRDTDGTVRVLLVTSRRTKRWIIPKGWPWRNCEDWVAAAGEAHEEAGVLGRVQSEPIGFFTYQKRQSGALKPVRVTIYRLEVTEILDHWPEHDRRQRAWFTLADAASMVAEPELQELLRGLATSPNSSR